MQTQVTVIERKRKALLILPLFLIPFLTMAFWALGGGRERDAAKEDKTGLNMQLPAAQLSDDADKTKLSFYETQEKQEREPFDSTIALPSYSEKWSSDPLKGYAERSPSLYDPAPPPFHQHRDTNEERVYQKLAELNTALAKSSSGSKANAHQTPPTQTGDDTDDDIDRLTAMMQKKQTKREPDPELDQLNGMMEKILDIQHPERVKASQGENKTESDKESLPVHRPVTKATESLLDTGTSPQKSKAAFWSLVSNERQASENTTEASVYQTQTLVTGSVITFRLLTDMQVGSSTIPKGSLLSGTCSLGEERLNVQVNSVRCGSSIYPVQLEAYDMDGIRGLYIPGAITRDVAKGSVDNAAQMLQLSTLDPSLKAQATTIGLDAVKSLLSKKAKLVRVVVKGGYRVLLKENNG